MKHHEIVQWVNAHRDSLPISLAELSTYPIPFRKVIVASVTPERRTAFWREHLETFIGPDTMLTADQQQLVRDAIEALPRMFSGSREEFEDRAKALEDRMRTLISRQQAATMFGMVGPPEPEGGLPLPADVGGVRA